MPQWHRTVPSRSASSSPATTRRRTSSSWRSAWSGSLRRAGWRASWCSSTTAAPTTPGTLIDELAARLPFVRAVHHPRTCGIAAAWESGLERATRPLRRRHGRRSAVPPGGRLPPLPPAQVLQRRRRAGLAQPHRPPARLPLLVSRSARLHAARAVRPAPVRHQVRASSSATARSSPTLVSAASRTTYFQTFIVVSAHHKGYRIEQIETLFEDRKLGKSFLSALPLDMIVRTWSTSPRGSSSSVCSARTDVLGDFLAEHPPTRPAGAAAAAAPRVPAPVRPAHAAAPLGRVVAGAALLLPAAPHAVAPPGAIRALQEQRLRALIQLRLPPRRRTTAMRSTASASTRTRSAARGSAAPAGADQGRHPPQPALRPDVRRARQAPDAADHHQRLDRRAADALRRQDAARDALGDDAAQHRVDRLSLRRPPGAPVALDDRHVAPPGVQGAARRAAHPAHVLPGLRDERGHDRPLHRLPARRSARP